MHLYRAFVLCAAITLGNQLQLHHDIIATSNDNQDSLIDLPIDCLFISLHIGWHQRKHWSSTSLVTGEFPSQRASNGESVSISWRHHDLTHHTRWVPTVSHVMIDSSDANLSWRHGDCTRCVPTVSHVMNWPMRCHSELQTGGLHHYCHPCSLESTPLSRL